MILIFYKSIELYVNFNNLIITGMMPIMGITNCLNAVNRVWRFLNIYMKNITTCVKA